MKSRVLKEQTRFN